MDVVLTILVIVAIAAMRSFMAPTEGECVRNVAVPLGVLLQGLEQRMPVLSLVVWAGSYGTWMAVQDMTYIILYGSGIFLALTAGILAWLTYYAGESAFNRVFCGALQAVGVAVVADISLSICAMALQTLLQLCLYFSNLYALIFYATFFFVGWKVC